MKIEEYLAINNLKIGELADKLGVSISLISKLVNGKCSKENTLKWESYIKEKLSIEIEIPYNEAETLQLEIQKLHTIIHEKELEIIDLKYELQTIYHLLQTFGERVQNANSLMLEYKGDIKELKKELNRKYGKYSVKNNKTTP